MTVSKTFLTLAGTAAKIPLPAYGVGTKWQHLKKGRPEEQKGTLDENLAKAIAEALKLGFRHIDAAEVYTTHDEVAEGIRLSGVDRSDVWITDKYSPGFKSPTVRFPAPSTSAFEAIQTALKEFKTDYIDLYLIHTQFFDPELTHNVTIEQAWADLEKAYEQGLVKNIGLSNFDSEHLQRVLKVAKIKPQVLQIEFHPYLQNQTPGIIKLAKENDILIEAYGPLTPLFRATDGPLAPLLKKLSEKYNKTEAQILLRWVYQNGVLPVTTSSNAQRITQALDAFEDEFELTEQDVLDITKTGSEYHFRGFFPDFENSK